MKLRPWRHLHFDLARGGLAFDETAPGFIGFVDDLHGVFLVLSLAGESELVFRLSIGDLVDPSQALG